MKIGNIRATGIVKSVNVNWKGPVSSLVSGGTYKNAEVSIQFVEVREAALGSISIKGGA